MATTQRITPTTTSITAPTISNDKIKKGAVYGGAGVAIAAALAGTAHYIHNLIIKPVPPVEAEDNIAENAEHTDVVQTVQPVHAPEPTSTTTSTTNSTTNSTPVHIPKPDPVYPDDPPTDVDVIAQEIIGREEIDNNDVHINPFVQFDNIGVYHDPMGNEYKAALFHMENGEQFKLVDLNHDGLFTEIFDLTGLHLGNVDDLDFPNFYFTEDDIRFALENEIGYVGPAAEPGDSEMDLESAAPSGLEVAQIETVPASSAAATGAVEVVDDIDTNDVDVQAVISAILDSPVETKDEVVIDVEPTDIELESDMDIAGSDDTDLDECCDTDPLS